MIRICTIIARNYLAQARVLAESVRRHHPGAEMVALLIDDEARTADLRGEPFSGVRLRDLGFGTREIHTIAAIYDAMELATAVKPALLKWLLASDHDHVIYLDPDIKIFDSLDPVVDLARQHGIVLTPHTTVHVPDDGRSITPRQILTAGVYNLGFIAVGAQATAFLDWWWDRTRREALNDPQRMMFTDQRWVDFVPSLFGHTILKDPGWNVAYWNLHGQPVSWHDGTYRVRDAPLRFFHFSGFEYHRPHLLSRHQGDHPRFLLSEHPALARICAEYRRDLFEAGIEDHAAVPYAWNQLPSGLVFEPRMRRVFWDAIVAHERHEGPEPPDPFDSADPNRFVDWLRAPVEHGPRMLSRYLRALFASRPDLQTAFPATHLGDVEGFLDWVRWTYRFGLDPEPIQSAFVPVEVTEAPNVATAPRKPGVHLAGYLRAASGVGEAARLLQQGLDRAGEAVALSPYDRTVSQPLYDVRTNGHPPADYDINVVCVNADELPWFAAEQGQEFFRDRHTCGYWFWELERFAVHLEPAFSYVDEVWAASDFTASALARCNRRPVFTIPLPLPAPDVDVSVTRADLGLPDAFMFLFCFDFLSVFERKNPLGLIKAFRGAFAPGEGPVLVIKTMHGDKRLNDLEALRAAVHDRDDIRMIDASFTGTEKDALMGHCDCYVSLHRSEGLGLSLAEAMSLGKPVIATAYSGNLMFMTPENSFLVDYTLAATPVGLNPYPWGIPWADPDLEQASHLLRLVYERPAEARVRAARARQDIMTRHGTDACAAAVAARLEAIRTGRRARMVMTPAMAEDAPAPEPGCRAGAPAEPGTLASRGRA